MKKSKTIEEIEKLSGLHNEAKGDIMLDSELTGLHNEAKGDIGLKQLREQREEIINRWEKSGLLEGLTGSKSNAFDFMKADENQTINEDPSQIIDD